MDELKKRQFGRCPFVGVECEYVTISDRIEALEVLLKEAGEALGKIERTPAWGYPDKWETTPAEVRQLARDALAKIKEATDG